MTLRPNFLNDPEERFWFMLTRDLKLGTVAETQNRISSIEFTNWKAFYLLENAEAERANQNR